LNKERFSIALSKDLKRWVEEEAKRESRSRSSLIEFILRRYRESRKETTFREKRIREPTGAIVT